MTEAEALVAKLKAERAAKLAKAMNGRAEVISMRPAEKPKRVEAVKPKLEIAPPKASDDITAPLLSAPLRRFPSSISSFPTMSFARDTMLAIWRYSNELVKISSTLF